MIRGELMLESPDQTYRWPLVDGVQVLGRVPPADLLLPLPVVSRQQMRIHCNEQGCWVENLSRTNPTYLIGRPVTAPTRLRDGDLLGIGRLRLRYRAVAQPTVVRGRLLIRQIGRSDRIEPLQGDRIVIGRDPRCDIVLDYPAISRRHLMFSWQAPQGFDLYDLRNHPGVTPPLVNGRTLPLSRPLAEGDEIWLGDGLGNGVTLIYLASNQESIHV